MRKFENLQYGDEAVIKASLDALADKDTNVNDYREAFRTLGVELGKVLASEYRMALADHTMLVCASEDADWLAAGVESGFGKGELKKSVYWNSREVIHTNEDGSKVEISPIEKAYEEPIDDCRLFVIVKSIISTSCVVMTQLTRLIGKTTPDQIAILAPVMHKDSVPNLMREFPEEISSKFHFITFAVDDEREGSEVVPGIGGMVYPRLGLGDMETKNRYIPEMVLRKM